MPVCSNVMPGSRGASRIGLELLLAPGDLLLDHLHRQAAVALRAVQHVAQLRDLPALVGGLGVGRDRQAS